MSSPSPSEPERSEPEDPGVGPLTPCLLLHGPEPRRGPHVCGDPASRPGALGAGRLRGCAGLRAAKHGFSRHRACAESDILEKRPCLQGTEALRGGHKGPVPGGAASGVHAECEGRNASSDALRRVGLRAGALPAAHGVSDCPCPLHR